MHWYQTFYDIANYSIFPSDIGDKISLKNPEEFSIQVMIGDKPEWLDGKKPLPDQVHTMDQLFIHKQFLNFYNDRANEDDPMRLHLVYTQSRDDIVAGNHPISKDEAIVFAALQCQVQCGDYKPDVHKSGWLS
jgi:talin